MKAYRTFRFNNAFLDGHDVIDGFHNDNPHAHDTIDLSAAFNHLGIPPNLELRASMVQIAYAKERRIRLTLAGIDPNQFSITLVNPSNSDLKSFSIGKGKDFIIVVL